MKIVIQLVTSSVPKTESNEIFDPQNLTDN